MNRGITVQELRAFLMAARLASFTKAAEHLGLTQPGLSMAIRQLEVKLGASLFDRRTTGAKLTGAGERFISAAEQMESAFLHALGEISGVDLELSGDVRIGEPDGFSTYYLAGALRDFAERHPAVRLQLMRGRPPLLTSRLRHRSGHACAQLHHTVRQLET